MKNTLLGLLSLMMLPGYAVSRINSAPEAGTEPVETNSLRPSHADEPATSGNVGAVNEAGGSVNTNGMNNGLSPNSSGSGTDSSRASDRSGFSFGSSGEDEPKGAVNPAQE